MDGVWSLRICAFLEYFRLYFLTYCFPFYAHDIEIHSKSDSGNYIKWTKWIYITFFIFVAISLIVQLHCRQIFYIDNRTFVHSCSISFYKHPIKDFRLFNKMVHRFLSRIVDTWYHTFLFLFIIDFDKRQHLLTFSYLFTRKITNSNFTPIHIAFRHREEQGKIQF